MRNTSAQKRLLAEADLTFKRALELARHGSRREKCQGSKGYRSRLYRERYFLSQFLPLVRTRSYDRGMTNSVDVNTQNMHM